MNKYTEPDFKASALITIDTQCDTLDGQPFEVAGTSAILPKKMISIKKQGFSSASAGPAFTSMRPIALVKKIRQPRGDFKSKAHGQPSEGRRRIVGFLDFVSKTVTGSVPNCHRSP